MKSLSVFLGVIFLSIFCFAETHFFKKKITINKTQVEVEIAETPEQHSQGLMNRRTLKENTGMLFIFSSTEPRTFWMKNTYVPLTIAYFDENKRLTETIDMQPQKTEMEANNKLYPSTLPAKYALEMPLGWFRKNNIKVGAKLKIH